VTKVPTRGAAGLLWCGFRLHDDGPVEGTRFADPLALTVGAVVAGVDGSEGSLAALDWAAVQAGLERRVLAIVHADGPGALADQGEVVLDTACARVAENHPDLELRPLLSHEDPRAALCQASEHAHLVVVGSRGMGPLKSRVLGSVGVSLTHHRRCPVVVRRPGSTAGGRGVLVGTDGLRASAPAVEWAFHHAALRGMPLTLVRAVDDGLADGEVTRDEPGHEGLWSQLEEAALQFTHRHRAVDVSLRLERGHVDEALARAAAGMDIVVVGSHVRRSTLGLVDLDVAIELVEHAPGFVAVVPGPD
jgi:nucleotide-binding universal stress UspA family protein